MSTHNITVQGGTSVRLLTASKYCDRDIVITSDITLQSKTVSPSTSSQSVTPDSGYDGLSQVTVNAMPSGSYSASVSLTSGSGSVSATGTNVTLTEASSEPSSGYYITAQGSGSVSGVGSTTISTGGFISPGGKSSTSSSKSSNTATKYYTVSTEEQTVTPSTSSQSVTPSSGKLLSKVTVNAMPTATIPTPVITVSGYGVISSNVLQAQGGYVAKGETASNTYNLSTQQGRTITPGTVEKTAVAKGKFTLNDVKVAGDANLVDTNIKKGVTIFGVTGSYEGASIPTCTVNVTFSYNPQNVTFYTPIVQNGAITYVKNSVTNGAAFTIQNVVCGAVISVSAKNTFYVFNWDGDFSVTTTSAAVFVPSSAGTYTLDIGLLDD